MKALILILTNLFVFSAYGDLIIKSYSNQHGPTHLDPINKEAYINYERTGSGKVRAFQTCPEKNNYFLYFERYTDPVNKRTRLTPSQARDPGSTCEEIKAQAERANKNTEIVGCRAFKTLEFRLEEENPNGGQRRMEHVNISFDEGVSKDGKTKFNIREAAKRCNCTNLPTQERVDDCINGGKGMPLIVVHGDKEDDFKDEAKTLFGNLDDTHQCAPPEKTIELPDADWANGVHDSMISADITGFYIGTKQYSSQKDHEGKMMKGNRYHTHYAFDNKQGGGLWCRYSLPCIPSTEDPTCKNGLNQNVVPVCNESINRQSTYSLDEKGPYGASSGQSVGFTRPMTFTEVGDMTNKRYYPSVVSLRKDVKTGKPYALIVPTTDAYQGGPVDENKHMDYSKPVVKVSFEFEPIRKTIFETYLKGKFMKRMTVSGSYTFGKLFNQQGVCQPNTCLHHFPNREKSHLSCSAKAHIPVNLGNTPGPTDLCYSCNGLTAGACIEEKNSDGDYIKELITSTNASAVEQSTLRCKNGDFEEDLTAIPTVDQ